jgi:tetratricopeptide (TPR) repeat protein
MVQHSLFAAVFSVVLALATAAKANPADALKQAEAQVARDPAAAALALFPLAESNDPAVNVPASLALGRALERQNLPVAAALSYAQAVKDGGPQPAAVQAMEALVALQPKLDDEDLIPTLLSNLEKVEAKLSPEAQGRTRFLLALVQQRKGKLEEALQLALSVDKRSDAYASARYLAGALLADPRLPSGPKAPEAVKTFREVLALQGKAGGVTPRTQQLAMLALGRTLYGMGQYAEASAAYEQVPRYSTYWDQALFENSFARFQADDYGGALGQLQALHAPQFEASFQPESWVLKAQVYYFTCLYDEAKSSLSFYDEIYPPIAQKLEPLLAKPPGEGGYLALAKKPGSLPRILEVWMMRSDRMRSVFALLERIGREQAQVKKVAAWQGAFADSLHTSLQETATTVGRIADALVRNRLEEAYGSIRSFSDQVEIIKFETTKAEKELFETGVDHKRVLTSQALYRPRVPDEKWNYWRFDGEFWLDEIGYYRYTLKRGCPIVAPGASAGIETP